jgi:hypothetical protein
MYCHVLLPILPPGPFGSREEVTQLLQAAGATLLTRPRANSTAGGGHGCQFLLCCMVLYTALTNHSGGEAGWLKIVPAS